MLKTRPRIALFHGKFHARLSASCGPPPRSVFGQFAHLDAASVRACFRAVAIASADGSRPHCTRSIGRKQECPAEHADQQGCGHGRKIPRKRLVAGEQAHEPSLQLRFGKTDSAERPKKLLPWSWNQFDAQEDEAPKPPVPDSVLKSSKLKSAARFGAVRRTPQLGQVSVNK